jgi:two-component system, OmpR family, response regulator
MSNMGDILGVENDDQIRTLLAETLGEEGYTVRSASDRTAMHLALATQPPDLLICDVDFDTGPSPTLIDDVCAIHGAVVPLVFLTTNVWTARSLARQGLTFCLLKPFDLSDLLTSVETHIHAPRQRAKVFAKHA